MEADEEGKLQMLLVVGIRAFNRALMPSVTDDNSEALCGWRLAQPKPQYRLAERKKLKRQSNKSDGSLTTLQPVVVGLKGGKQMTGKLTEDCDYVYEGRPLNESTIIIPSSTKVPRPPQYHHHVVPQQQMVLNPISTNRSDRLSQKARENIHRLAQLQLNADIDYEKMIIDEKLRKIDLNSACEFRIGRKILDRPDHTHSNISRSNSDTSVLSQHKKRRKPKPRPLDWTLLRDHTPSFKSELTKCHPVAKSSFSRLLESSSVIYSYKKQ